MSEGDFETRARSYLAIQSEGLLRLADSVGPSLGEAVELIHNAPKVLVCGVGKSWHIGRKIAATFTSTGTPAVALHASEARHGDLGLAQPGDLAIVISFSGESEEIRELTLLLKQRNIYVIALTRCCSTWLGTNADCCLDVPVQREACQFNLVPTTSSLVTLALGDLLAVLASERRGFTEKEFGSLHPAGAIGHSLRPIRDVMRSGDRLAKLDIDAPLREALVVMTSARCGAVVVTNAEGLVSGILTDGDVRRHLVDEGEGALDVAVREVMSTEPVTILADAMVADAWALFSIESINDLVVVEADGKPAGLLDLQDLPKLKHF